MNLVTSATVATTGNATGFPTIGHGPSIKPSVVRSVQQQDNLVATLKGTLMEVIKP